MNKLKIQENYINTLKTLDKYPIELLVLKKLIEHGIDSEQELVDTLKTVEGLSGVWINKLQNGYRDIFVSHIYKLEDIPNMDLFYK